MPSLKAIRKRIASVKNTQKITKAMKMVAAAKLRRAQDGVMAMRPYARRMGQVARDLAEHFEDERSSERREGEGAQGIEDDAELQKLVKLLRGAAEQKISVVVVTSDRGLAGGFNSNVVRRTERLLVEQTGKDVTLTVLGKKGRDALRRKKGVKIGQEMPGVESKNAVDRARELAAQLAESLLSGEADAIYAVYNEFKNAASQTIRAERILPVAEAPAANRNDDAPRTLVDFAYEPSRKEVLEHLVPLYIETELLRIFLESIASEFGARMSAMDNASRNAKEAISRLTLQYNRARQAAITKELMEIVGGAEALKG